MEETALLDTPKRTAISTKSAALRADLKRWEKKFAESNGGRRAQKSDIKQHPDIAAKYKEYNRLRDSLADWAPVTSIEPSSSPESRQLRLVNKKQNTGSDAQYATPRKQRSQPTVCGLQPYNLDPYDTPSHASPRPHPYFVRPTIGPTPHRDGRAVGLFDLLARSGSSLATPSSRKRKADALHEIDGNIARTPSRTSREGKSSRDILDCSINEQVDENRNASRERFSRTPVSQGRNYLLSRFFITPSATRYHAIIEEDRLQERGSLEIPVVNISPEASKQMLITTPRQVREGSVMVATPSFLKRPSFNQRLLSVSHSQKPPPTASQAFSFSSPEAVRTGPRNLRPKNSRSLSEIVNNLQKLDDERHADDLEALRDIEDGQPAPRNLVDDRERDVLENRGAESTHPREPEPGPARRWKKKGQKRTTRRVNMKPSSAKPVEAPQWIDGESEDELVAVQETQFLDSPRSTEDRATASVGDENINDLEAESVRPLSDKTKKKGSRNRKGPSATATSEQCSNGSQLQQRNPQGDGKKRTYNPNATSHLNFRSLKIKNRNSKAKGRGFGRGFGRRR